MRERRKTVKFDGHDYLIEHSYYIYRNNPETINHEIRILKLDGNEIVPFNHHWVENEKYSKNIIQQVFIAIKNYFEKMRTSYTPLDEFYAWDGNLDDWKEKIKC